MTIRKVLLLATVLAALPLGAQDAKPKPEAPVISAELRARVWRALAELREALAASEKAQSRMKDAQAEMGRVCGAGQVTVDPQGEPACGVKPAPKPEAATPDVP